MRRGQAPGSRLSGVVLQVRDFPELFPVANLSLDFRLSIHLKSQTFEFAEEGQFYFKCFIVKPCPQILSPKTP